MSHTTLRRIHNCEPCREGWKKLLRHLGKTGPDSEPLSLLTILESNGIGDAIWAFRATDLEKEVRLFAVFCARQVAQYSQQTAWVVDVAERYAYGKATAEELAAARAAAWAAVSNAASYAVSNAASAAASAAASDAARAAAWAAASYAASDAASYAASYAAWAAIKEAQAAELRRLLNF